MSLLFEDAPYRKRNQFQYRAHSIEKKIAEMSTAASHNRELETRKAKNALEIR